MSHVNHELNVIHCQQVLWLGDEDCHVSWEKEELIPKDVLEEYKSDSLVQVEQLSTEGIGQTSHTLCVSSTEKDQVPVPESKKQKCDRIVVHPDNGYGEYIAYIFPMASYMYVSCTQISKSDLGTVNATFQNNVCHLSCSHWTFILASEITS